MHVGCCRELQNILRNKNYRTSANQTSYSNLLRQLNIGFVCELFIVIQCSYFLLYWGKFYIYHEYFCINLCLKHLSLSMMHRNFNSAFTNQIRTTNMAGYRTSRQQRREPQIPPEFTRILISRMFTL